LESNYRRRKKRATAREIKPSRELGKEEQALRQKAIRDEYP
jgi:hypothetical protein